MINQYRFTSVVSELPSSVPFVGPEAQQRARGAKFRARIGANESVFGPSPKVIAALQSSASEIWQYGDPENYDLKDALAAFLGIPFNNIVIGEGIDGLFGNIARLLVEPGATVVTSLGAYPTFNFQVSGSGGNIKTVPYKHDHEDPDALIALAKKENARLIYLANPDNPMGTWWNGDVIQHMVDRVPDGCVLCLDEAYGEFAPTGTLPPIDIHDGRVLRFRTFSKAYGLAGCRVAYAIGEAQLVKAFDKIRNHFGVNRLAQVAALSALADQAYLKDVIGKVEDARNRIIDIARDNELESLASAANFVAIDCGHDGNFARKVISSLIGQGIFVRMPGVAPLDRCIRVGAGTNEQLDLFAEKLPQALNEASSG